MSQQPYKICPRCQQPAALDAAQCVGCGRVFRSTHPGNQPTNPPVADPATPAGWICACGCRYTLASNFCNSCGLGFASGWWVYPDGSHSLVTQPEEPSTPTPAQTATPGCWGAYWKWAAAFVLIAMVWGQLNPTPPGGNATYAQWAAEKAVKGMLKSPSTAKFDSGHARVWKRGTNGWTVKGSVDAQNSFGAMVRSEFTCEMEYDEKTQDYRPTNVMIDP